MSTDEALPTTHPDIIAQRGLWVMRVLYFLYFAAVGAYWTFLNVYYKSIGMSGTQIGLINTAGPLVAIVAATLWSILNDRLGRPRTVLRIAVPGVIVSALALSTVEQIWPVVLFGCLVALFNSATVPLMDNTTLRLLGEQRGQYGRYRVLGSFGFILTSLLAGYIYEITGLRAIFYGYALILGLLLLATTWLPNERVALSGSFRGGLSQMVRQPAWLLFAAAAFLLWVSNNGTVNFIGIAVEEMGGSEGLIGMVWMMAALTEVPIMINSEWLLRRVGNVRLLAAAFGFFALRSALLAVMPTPELAVAIAGLGGIAFAFFWISAVAYANESAPDNLKSTAQGLLFSVLNLAGMAGSLLSGYLFDHVGRAGLFWAMSGFAVAGLVVFVGGRLKFK